MWSHRTNGYFLDWIRLATLILLSLFVCIDFGTLEMKSMALNWISGASWIRHLSEFLLLFNTEQCYVLVMSAYFEIERRILSFKGELSLVFKIRERWRRIGNLSNGVCCLLYLTISRFLVVFNMQWCSGWGLETPEQGTPVFWSKEYSATATAWSQLRFLFGASMWPL